MSYNNPRIKDPSMSIVDCIVALAGGNPGAVTAISECMKNESKIDPDSSLAPYGVLFQLDTLDIYGSKIWMLYKDVCKQDVKSMIGVLRANQLGILTANQIKTAIDAKPDFDPAEVVKQVQAKLPAFAATE